MTTCTTVHIGGAHTAGHSVSAEGVDPARERFKDFQLPTAHKIARSLPGSHSNRSI